jgi:hypothetical protein
MTITVEITTWITNVLFMRYISSSRYSGTMGREITRVDLRLRSFFAGTVFWERTRTISVTMGMFYELVVFTPDVLDFMSCGLINKCDQSTKERTHFAFI